MAAIIAALGTLLVFLYVRGADQRADSRYDAVQVLRAVKPIAPGEAVDTAQAEGKIESGTVARQDFIPGGLTSLEPITGRVALTAITPGEQIVDTKFGANGATSSLTIPKGKLAISVNLTDPSRVAGFVNPGDNVAIFMTGTLRGKAGASEDKNFTRMLLSGVQVLGAGTTTVVSTTTTDPDGAQTSEQLPNTLLTLAVSQPEAERILYAAANGALAFGLLNTDSSVKPSEGVDANNLFR